MSLLDIKKLEHTLQTHWTEFLDTVQLMRVVLEHVRNTTFPVVAQGEIPNRHTKISITKFSLSCTDDFDAYFDVWIEYSVPKNEGVIVGTLVTRLSFYTALQVLESYGTEFRPQT